VASRQRCTSATEASSAHRALEHLGDAAIEAFGARAHLRGQVAGENRRELAGSAQNDQVTIIGRGIGERAA
jgi:hypothetical protein